MSRVFQALVTEPWAIVPSELQKMAAILQRHHEPSALGPEGPAFLKRDYAMMAGPGAQRLPGSQVSHVIDGVAVIPVVGPIFPRANMMTEHSGATSVSSLQNDLRVALANPEVGSVLIQMDTPGGAVSGIAAFAEALAAGAKRKPTAVHVMGMGASAGYWIASAAGRIAMDRTAMVGSIGVVGARPVQVAPDANGDMWIEIVSSNAPNKRPDPTQDEGRAELVSELDAIEAIFLGDVAKGRNVSTSRVLSDFGRGGVLIGASAVQAGMADVVQAYDVTLNEMRREAANQRRLGSLRRKST